MLSTGPFLLPSKHVCMWRLWLRHVAHARCCAADGHACLEVVDEVCDERDEDEENEDDEEDDDVALHGCGGVVCLAVWVWVLMVDEPV
ncbi:hypothetical protein FB567DRAFT_539699, partial [Paraphoma chrysanthemicola]